MTIIRAEFAKMLWPKMRQRWRRHYAKKTKAPRRPRKQRNDIMSSIDTIKTATAALRNAANNIMCGFVWKYTPEGQTYWSLQMKHLNTLADQVDRNIKAYVSE